MPASAACLKAAAAIEPATAGAVNAVRISEKHRKGTALHPCGFPNLRDGVLASKSQSFARMRFRLRSGSIQLLAQARRARRPPIPPDPTDPTDPTDTAPLSQLCFVLYGACHLIEDDKVKRVVRHDVGVPTTQLTLGFFDQAFSVGFSIKPPLVVGFSIKPPLLVAMTHVFIMAEYLHR